MTALLLVLLPLLGLTIGYIIGGVVAITTGAQLIRDHAEGPTRAERDDVDEDQADEPEPGAGDGL